MDLLYNSFCDSDCVLYARPHRTVENGLEKVDCEMVFDDEEGKFVSTLPERVESKLCASENSVCAETKPAQPSKLT
eukprot:6195749-Pleurochrysis_carterae.AAC.3